ncbi:MAG TPA: hypothetical protein VIY48_14595, partial [Candidatus Paceibacterota bacterium]
MSTLTGTVRDAAGNALLVNGKIWFVISQNANVIAGGGCGGPYAISPGTPDVFTLVNGAIQGSPTIPGQSCISPSNTFYNMSVITDDGVLVLRRNVVIDGASVDIGALAAPVLPGQTGIAGPQGAAGLGFSAASANDIKISTAGLEHLRLGPDAGGTNARDAWFQGPVNIGLDPSNSFAIRDIGGGLSLQTLRVYTKVLSAPSPTIYQGISVGTNPGEVTADSFFHGITTDVHVNSPLHLGSPSNEIAGGAFFAYQHGHGSVFGVDSATTAQPDATGFPPNFIGVNSQLFNNVKTGTNNTSLAAGFLTTQGSTGRPGSSQAFRSSRRGDLDYVTGTVAVTNGSAVITGTGTNWTTAGPSPFYNFANKPIKLPNGVYTISSVDSATQITLTTNYTGATLSGQTYKIRTAEAWSFGLYLSGLTGSEGVLVEQDADFNNPVGSAFRVLNPAGTINNIFLDMGGNGTFVGKVSAGQLEAIASAAGNMPLLARGGASPTADIAQFQINSGSAVRSRVDKEGSLKTDEAARVAPWIEPEVRCGTATNITSTTATDITGATVTFTPKSDCRVHVTAFFDVTETAAGASVFVGELVVNGTARSAQVIFDPVATGIRNTAGQVWNFT